MNMNMIFTHNTFQDLYFLHFTGLIDQLTASLLNVSFQYMVSVFGNPHDMTSQLGRRVASFAHWFCHSSKNTKF
jgi:hypothetical protein